jgi:hypothetical protein
MKSAAPFTAIALLSLGAGSANSTSFQEIDHFADLADRYCIEPDGDHRLTWHRAEQDGFIRMTPADIPRLYLPGSFAPNLRGLQRTSNGTTIRILTSAFRWSSPGDGESFFRQCWVSTTDDAFRRTQQDLTRLLDLRPFRSREVVIFAWIPQPDGGKTPVSRRDYHRQHLTLSRERGLRQVFLRQYDAGVFLGYSSPRDEATYRDFDWAGPEPVAPPR